MIFTSLPLDSDNQEHAVFAFWKGLVWLARRVKSTLHFGTRLPQADGSAWMICCTRMENIPENPNPVKQAHARMRNVRLHRAFIRTDGTHLRRTAEFTDGSTGVVEMKWGEVRRVAAFRRDVLTEPVLCVAITDSSKVVVLDESMDGWKSLLEGVSKYLKQTPSFSEWQERIGRESPDSYWTMLFRAAQ